MFCVYSREGRNCVCMQNYSSNNWAISKTGNGKFGKGMGNGERGMGIKSRNPLYKLFIQTLRDFVDTCHALSRTPMLKH